MAVRNAVSNKPNSRCFTDDTANLVVKLGSAHKAYYHPKVEEAFQLWLKKNQATQTSSFFYCIMKIIEKTNFVIIIKEIIGD